MSNIQIMLDYAGKDSRSFRAMVEGSGDGREQIWIGFEKAHPKLNTEVLMELFDREVRFGSIEPNNIFRRCLSAKGYLYLMLLFVFVI